MKISDLDVDQLANYAMNAFMVEGSSQTTARLLYRALTIEPRHANTLIYLVQFIMESGQALALRATLAAPVLAYLAQPDVSISLDDREYFRTIRTLCLHQWGFSRHKTDKTSAKMGDFAKPDLFDIDEDGFAQFVLETIEPVGSIENALAVAHTIVGVAGKALKQEELNKAFDNEEFLHPERLISTIEYQMWLELSVDALPILKTTNPPKHAKERILIVLQILFVIILIVLIIVAIAFYVY